MKICLLSPNAKIPTKAHSTDAGWDLYSSQSLTLEPKSITTVFTDVTVEIPKNHAGMVCSRSGLAAKSGIIVANAPGIIDHGFTGNIGIILFNTTAHKYQVNKHDKIAQLLIVPLYVGELEIVDSLTESERSVFGFGSTGR